LSNDNSVRLKLPVSGSIEANGVAALVANRAAIPKVAKAAIKTRLFVF
jgi:hypothetical protein